MLDLQPVKRTDLKAVCARHKLIPSKVRTKSFGFLLKSGLRILGADSAKKAQLKFMKLGWNCSRGMGLENGDKGRDRTADLRVMNPI